MRKNHVYRLKERLHTMMSTVVICAMTEAVREICQVVASMCLLLTTTVHVQHTADLILCDFCPKAFHMECHIPRLLQIPKGQWRCCECSAMLYEKRQRCGECEGCRNPECGACPACKRKKKFGGDGKHSKPCKDRQCKNMRYAAPERTSIKGNKTTGVKANNVTLNKPAGVKFNNVKRIKSSATEPKAMSSSLVVCPFQTSSEPTPNNGFNSCEVKILRLKPSNKMRFFFGEMFQGKTLRVESKLNDENPERTVIHVSRHFTNNQMLRSLLTNQHLFLLAFRME